MPRKRKNPNFVAEGTSSNVRASSDVAPPRRSNRLISPTLTNPTKKHLNFDKKVGEEDRFPKKVTIPVHGDLAENQHCYPDESDDEEHQHSEDPNLDENDKEKDEVFEDVDHLEKQTVVEEMIDLQAAAEANVEAENEYIVQSEDEFKFNNDNPPAARSRGESSQDLSYKNLYIRAQKKIEVLMEEKFALLQELQFSRGQISAFEKLKDMFTTREVIVVPSLPNATTSALTAQGRLQNNNYVQSYAADEDRNAIPKAKTKTYARKKRKN